MESLCQLFLQLLALENDINELRKDLLEIMDDINSLLIDAVNLKVGAMQVLMLGSLLQSMLAKLLALIPGPAGPAPRRVTPKPRLP